jgi:hypothetical protein
LRGASPSAAVRIPQPYALQGEQLRLTGRFSGESEPTTLLLARRQVRRGSAGVVPSRAPAR